MSILLGTLLNGLLWVAGRAGAAVAPGPMCGPFVGACETRGGGLSCPLPLPAGRGVARGGCPLDDDLGCFPPAPRCWVRGQGGNIGFLQWGVWPLGVHRRVLHPSITWVNREEESS
jgi:hypothetical protein